MQCDACSAVVQSQLKTMCEWVNVTTVMPAANLLWTSFIDESGAMIFSSCYNLCSGPEDELTSQMERANNRK